MGVDRRSIELSSYFSYIRPVRSRPRQAIAVGKRHCRVLYLCYLPHLPKKCCKTRAIAPPLFAAAQALCMRHCQDAISLERSVKTLKPNPLSSIKVYPDLSLLQVKDSKPPFLVTRLGTIICISGYLESKL